MNRLPRLAPPRIAICGGSSIDDKTAQFCYALGRLLAAKKYTTVLVHGGCKKRRGNGRFSVDWHTIKGAMSVVGDDKRRIETILPGDDPGLIKKFTAGNPIKLKGATPQARRFRMLASADVAVAVAGDTGTRQHLDLALAIQKPLLPVPFFGGEAALCWKGRDRSELIRSMGLSPKDVAFLDSDLDDTKRGRTYAAERVCRLLMRRVAKVCMVIMPFASRYDELYERVLRRAIQNAGLVPLRTDRLTVPIDIMDVVNRGIESCVCAIAVLDGARPNVYYELGRAHAFSKQVILLLSAKTKPPFDIAGLSLMSYTSLNSSLARRVEQQLRSIAAETAPPPLKFAPAGRNRS
jgi:hypothetical protein